MDPHKKPSWQRDLAYCMVVHPPAIIGIFLLSLFAAVGLELVLKSDVVDRVFFKPPFYPIDIALGFEIGFLLNRSLRSRSACFAWIIGLIPVWIDCRALFQLGGSRAVLEFVSGAHCGTCLEQLFAIAPFQITVAYSLGSLLALKWANWKSDRRVVPAEASGPAATESSTSQISELL